MVVSFRVSREEADRIDALVAVSGLSKQDYILARLMQKDVRVIPSSRVYKALYQQMGAVYRELRRVGEASEIGADLADVIDMLSREFAALGTDELISDTEREARAVFLMERG